MRRHADGEAEVHEVSSADLILLLEQECERLSSVVEAAIAWSQSTTEGRTKAERRLRHAVTVLTARHMVS